jgi:hypothetical protein
MFTIELQNSTHTNRGSSLPMSSCGPGHFVVQEMSAPPIIGISAQPLRSTNFVSAEQNTINVESCHTCDLGSLIEVVLTSFGVPMSSVFVVVHRCGGEGAHLFNNKKSDCMRILAIKRIFRRPP